MRVVIARFTFLPLTLNFSIYWSAINKTIQKKKDSKSWQSEAELKNQQNRGYGKIKKCLFEPFDDVVPKLGFYRSRYLTFLQIKRRILEFLHHLASRESP